MGAWVCCIIAIRCLFCFYSVEFQNFSLFVCVPHNIGHWCDFLNFYSILFYSYFNSVFLYARSLSFSISLAHTLIQTFPHPPFPPLGGPVLLLLLVVVVTTALGKVPSLNFLPSIVSRLLLHAPSPPPRSHLPSRREALSSPHPTLSLSATSTPTPSSPYRVAMGVASFLLSMWRPLETYTTTHGLFPASELHVDASPHHGKPRLLATPRHVAFTLPDKVYTWLEAMAVTHNYGSVHKSVRDLLAWACTAQDDDLDWLFATPHELPSCLDREIALCELAVDHDASCIAGKQPFARLQPLQDAVSLDARVSDVLYHWICMVVHRYSLCGPSAVLETVCRCAIELQAADDIFESDESGHDLPESTAELYHDLGLIRFAPSHSPTQ